MLESSKLDTVVTFDFPENSPEFKLTFSRLSYGEESFIYEAAFKEKGISAAGANEAFVMAFAGALFRALQSKLKGWEHPSFTFNDDNRKLFFDSLDFTQRQQLVSAYQSAVTKLREAALGNVPM